MVQLESLLPCFCLLVRIATSCVGTFDLSIVILMLQTILGPEAFVVDLLQIRDVGIGSELFAAKESALFQQPINVPGLVGWLVGMGDICEMEKQINKLLSPCSHLLPTGRGGPHVTIDGAIAPSNFFDASSDLLLPEAG